MRVCTGPSHVFMMTWKLSVIFVMLPESRLRKVSSPTVCVSPKVVWVKLRVYICVHRGSHCRSITGNACVQFTAVTDLPCGIIPDCMRENIFGQCAHVCLPSTTWPVHACPVLTHYVVVRLCCAESACCIVTSWLLSIRTTLLVTVTVSLTLLAINGEGPPMQQKQPYAMQTPQQVQKWH